MYKGIQENNLIYTVYLYLPKAWLKEMIHVVGGLKTITGHLTPFLDYSTEQRIFTTGIVPSYLLTDMYLLNFYPAWCYQYLMTKSVNNNKTTLFS